MSLIKCIECNHEMSSYADKCPNCGCPNFLSEEISVPEDLHLYNVELKFVPRRLEYDIKKYLTNDLKINKRIAESMLDSLPSTIAEAVSQKEANIIASAAKGIGAEVCVTSYNINRTKKTNKDIDRNRVICPQCGSGSISTTARGYSIWTGFWGAWKTVNRCAKCGYAWKP